MLLHPQELGRGEPRKGNVARPREQLVLADRLVEVGNFLLRSPVVPKDGGADDVVIFVERDKAMHLSAEGDALNGGGILPFEQFLQPAQNGFIPILGGLFAPAGAGIADGINLRILRKNFAVRGDEQKFHPACAEVDSNITVHFS